MPSFAIIPYRDPLEDSIFGLLSGGEGSLEHQFIFQAGPEALDDGIVPAVADSAHAAIQVELGELVLVLFAGVLGASIGVVQERMPGPAVGQGHLQGLDAEVGVQGILHAPADDLSAEKIDDPGEVEQAFIGVDIRDIGGPFLVGSLGGEVAVESILKDGVIVIGIGGSDTELSMDDAGDAVLFHPFGDGVEAAAHTLFQQIPVDIGASVAAVGFNVRLADGLDDPVALAG